MATDIVLRSVKAASLNHAEMDQNWESLAQTVDAVTSNKTVAVADQNKILEASISTGTITLPTVSNASGTDTDSFKITIKNINATSLTVDGNGSETIEGAASVILLENEAAEFSLSSGATEWNITGFYNPSLVGITSTAAEINVLDGMTSTTSELNVLDGITPTTTELNYVNGVTSAIQTQIDTKAANGANSDITSLSGLTTDLSIAQGGTAASTASGARTSLGVDVAGTDNSTDVTLAGTPNYLTIAGQVVTRALISLTTHITGILPIANGGTASSTAAGARTSLGLGSLAVKSSIIPSDIDFPNSLGLIQGAIVHGGTSPNSSTWTTLSDVYIYIPPETTILEYRMLVLTTNVSSGNTRLSTDTNTGTGLNGESLTLAWHSVTGSLTISDKSGWTIINIQGQGDTAPSTNVTVDTVTWLLR